MTSYPPKLNRTQIRRNCLLRAEVGDQIECHMHGPNISSYNPDNLKLFTVIATKKDKYPIIGTGHNFADCFWTIKNNTSTFDNHRLIDNFLDFTMAFRTTSTDYVNRIIKAKAKLL
jgi:hypothetical protein